MARTDLTAYNTLGLPATARDYLRLDDMAALAALPAHDKRFILGGGSNLVLGGEIDALVVHVALKGRRLLADEADGWLIEAAAGENWHDFVLWTLAQGWPGLENLALIPGQVGAAPVQNIGAYGLEAGERIAGVRCWDFAAGRPVSMTGAECRFGYRDSVFKQNGWHRNGERLITSVIFRLDKTWTPRLAYAELARELGSAGSGSPSPRQVLDAVVALRRRKLPDPAEIPNAGSFFENPVLDAGDATRLAAAHPGLPRYPQADGRVKVAAGWLIEQAGWKGRDLGPVGMFERQALVLVNRGGASAADVMRLVAAVRADVLDAFGVSLQPEPVFVGSEVG